MTTTELQAFKDDLTGFLKTSALAMEKRAASLTPANGNFASQAEKYKVLELVNTAIAHMNIVVMVKEGVFSEAN
jgi:hypothetical protein